MTVVRCEKMVWRDWRSSQCFRKAVLDGFCRQHHPDATAARDAAREAKWARERRLSDAKTAVVSAENTVLNAALAWEYDPAYDRPVDVALVKAVEALCAAREAHRKLYRQSTALANDDMAGGTLG